MRNVVKTMVPTGIIRLLVIIALCCFICPHVTADDGSYSVGDNNSDISIEIDEMFDISLESNPTTGYEWDVKECDYSVLELVNTGYEPAENQTPPVAGAGGLQNWTFKGLKDGETALKIVYWRSWEGEESIVDEYLLHITVGGATITATQTPEVTQSVESTPSATQSPAPTQTKDTPCFEAVFAIAGLLAVAYLIRGRD
jgi:inhibitor of cysteine peptidase